MHKYSLRQLCQENISSTFKQLQNICKNSDPDTRKHSLIVLCFGVEFFYCFQTLCVFIYSVKLGQLSGHLWGNSC